jgi:rRNA maturation protein Nop10
MKTLAIASVLALTAAFAFAQDKKPAPAPAPAQNPPAAKPAPAPEKQDSKAAIAAQRACYPLEKCPISGEKLGATAVDTIVDGRLIRTCCDKCVPKLDAKKAEIFKQIDDGVIAAQKAAYPLEKCPVSGEKLDADPKMKPVDYVAGTRLVRFCCDKCIAKFQADPSAVMAKLDAAYIASQKAKYTVDTCPVSGEKLTDKAVDVLYGNKLIRMCCPDCKAELAKTPDKVLAKLAELQAAAKPAAKKS